MNGVKIELESLVTELLDEKSLPGGDGYIEVHDDIIYVTVSDLEYVFSFSVTENLDPIPSDLDQTGALVAPPLEEAQGAVAEVDGGEPGLPEDMQGGHQ